MRKKILVVDDEPDIIAVMKYTLERRGFEVITAYNGEEAIAKAKESKPDLMVVDVLMPKMSGDAAVASLRDNPSTSSIPVIFLTNVPIDFLQSSEKMPPVSLPGAGSDDLFLPKFSSEEDFLKTVYMKLGIEEV